MANGRLGPIAHRELPIAMAIAHRPLPIATAYSHCLQPLPTAIAYSHQGLQPLAYIHCQAAQSRSAGRLSAQLSPGAPLGAQPAKPARRPTPPPCGQPLTQSPPPIRVPAFS